VQKKSLYRWWQKTIFEPDDPRYFGASTAKVVAIGGGTGLSTLLRGIKQHFRNISAIVTVTDDGASSGELRREFDMLPPGDIRKCISAMTEDEELVSKIFEYRFQKGKGNLSGHTLGNIWIAALTQYFGSFEKAIETTSEIFKTKGVILPATLDSIKIGARYEDGKTRVGESKIPRPGRKISSVFIIGRPKAYKKAVSKIAQADLIIIGPGSLYTSIIPNLLIPGIKRAVSKNKKAVKIFVANCSTERGETEGLGVEDHIKTIRALAKSSLFDLCLANNKIISRAPDDSRLGEIQNIIPPKQEVKNCKTITRNIIDKKNPLRHDSKKLGKAIADIYSNSRSL
jgi:uncharacterized cofD-like protein